MSHMHFLDPTQRDKLRDSRRRQRQGVSPGWWVALLLAGILLLGLIDAQDPHPSPHTRPVPVNGVSR